MEDIEDMFKNDDDDQQRVVKKKVMRKQKVVEKNYEPSHGTGLEEQ